MIGPFITIAVDGTALYLRRKERKAIMQLVDSRYKWHLGHSPIMKNIYAKISRDPYDVISDLKSMKDNSHIVFLDCILELCNTEEQLLELWNEAKRVSESLDDLFVLYIQKWSNARLNFDPKVRWVILEAPPKVKTLELKYRPYGARKTILADVRVGKEK
jgi:transcription termination factor NusB